MDKLQEVTDFLLSRINIIASGACGPKREAPIECFQPILQRYHHGATENLQHPVRKLMNEAVPGGSLRPTAALLAGEQPSSPLIFDRDEKAFETVLAKEIFNFAVEVYLDNSEGEFDIGTNALLHHFGDWIASLDTHVLSLPVADILSGIIDLWAKKTTDQSDGATIWSAGEIEHIAREFLYTRECFHHVTDDFVATEVKFSVPNYRLSELDMELNLTWIPPVLQLHELQNVVFEGDELSIEPFVAYRGKLQVIGEYSLGPECHWLSWDYAARAFRGRVPGSLAADIGAERHEIYTTAIELTALVSWIFPSDIVFQRVYRCALPITVKRSVDRCDAIQEAMKSPSKPPYPLYKPVSRPELAVMQRPPTHRSLSYDCDKENAQVRSISEDAKLLRRKAESLMRSPSPIQMDSLSLARFYDAAASAPFGPPLEVRAMYDIRYGEVTSPATKEMRRETPSPAKSPPEPLDLGKLHINKCGELVSSSESGNSEEQRHDSVLSPRATVITPPVGTPEGSAKKGKRPLRELLEGAKQAEKHTTCYTCKTKGRNPNVTVKEGWAICLTCRQASFFERVLAHKSVEQSTNGASARQSSQSGSNRRTTAEWQAEIKENYKEFETEKEGSHAKHDDLDITMHDVVDSDENLSFSQLEVEEQ